MVAVVIFNSVTVMLPIITSIKFIVFQNLVLNKRLLGGDLGTYSWLCGQGLVAPNDAWDPIYGVRD